MRKAFQMLLHKLFGKCEWREMSPVHYVFDPEGKPAYFHRMNCKICDKNKFVPENNNVSH